MDNQQEKCIEEMDYVVGVMLGDGLCALSDMRPLVQLEMMDSEVVELFARAVNQQFGLSHSISYRERGGTKLARYTTRNKECFEFFRDITAHRQFFPEWYFTAPQRQQLSLLAGLWDTDGYVAISAGTVKGKAYHQPHVGFSNTSQRLVLDTARLLEMQRVRVSVLDIPVQGNRRPQWRARPNIDDFLALQLPLQCRRKAERCANLREQRREALYGLRCAPALSESGGSSSGKKS
jgi:hypothetical protein